MPAQLLLDLAPATPPGFANFVCGDNAETLAHLRALPTSQGFRALYLWGVAGSGKSHLLHACARSERPRRSIHRLTGNDLPAPEQLPAGALLLVDDVHRLDAAAQGALFRLFNNARHGGLALLIAGPCAPLALDLREDLRTRIGQSLVLHLHPLSDADKRAALLRHAAVRGMRLDEAIVMYLMNHTRRDLTSLLALVDQLDHLSLEQKRLPTLPLLRELMHGDTLPTLP